MWVCIAILCVCAIDYKTPSVCSLGTSCVCAVGSHVSAYVQARLHVSMWLQASSHTWGRGAMIMRERKCKEERRKKMRFDRWCCWEERVTRRQWRGDWYRSVRRRLRQQQNWTHWTLCGPDWSQWLPALTPLHSETHTHTQRAPFTSNHWHV